MTTASQPLSGVTVVEIGTSVAAPFGTWILGCLGAKVIKIESAKGDDARQWGRMFSDGRSSFFLALNANKQSITVDLRDPDQQSWLKDFCVEQADVVLQNMRPGKIAELGLDGPSLTLENSRLVYFNLGAFGAKGPKAMAPGYDPLMQAAGGIMSVTGEPDRPPVRVGALSSTWALACGVPLVFSRLCFSEKRRGVAVSLMAPYTRLPSHGLPTRPLWFRSMAETQRKWVQVPEAWLPIRPISARMATWLLVPQTTSFLPAFARRLDWQIFWMILCLPLISFDTPTLLN